MKLQSRLGTVALIVAAYLCLFEAQISLATPPATGVKLRNKEVLAKQFNAKRAFDLHSEELHTLMLGLYECKPHELMKNTQVSKEEYVQWVFEGPFEWKFDTIRKIQSVEAIRLSLSHEYKMDRVLPLVTGLYTMLLQAYSGTNSFTFVEDVKAERLMVAATNISTVMTKLEDIRQEEDGTVYLSESCKTNTKKKLNNISKRLLDDYQLITKLPPDVDGQPRISIEFIEF